MPAQLAGAKDEVGVPTRSESSGIASRWGSYIVVMKANPLAATVGVDDLGTAPARNRESRLLASHNRVLRSLGAGVTKIHDYTVALNGFSALMSPEQAATVAANKNVVLVLPDELHQPQTDSSPAFLGLSATPGGAYASGVDGEGVVVGVIDTGIWPEHPSFADDGSYPEPPPPPGVPPTVLRCEFGNTAHNPNDAPFACNNKLIGADQVLDTYREILGADPDEFDSARDDDGHGSHTASTAAGNSGVEASVLDRNIATIAGIAPRAHISVYKALGNQGGFGSDLAEAIDLAVEDGVDVINYSIGGGASLTGADDIAFLFAADAGVFVATSAGNSGPGEATIGGPASVPWLTTVGANTQSRFFEGTVILGNGAEYTGASITHGVGPAKVVDAATSSHHGSDLCLAGTLRRGKVRDAIVLCRRGPGRVAKSQEVMRAGGVGMILYENSDAGNLFSDTHWVPSVHVDNTPGLAIKSYIASAEKKKLATAELVTGEVSTWPNAPTMTDFSSRGPDPVAEDIIKPDVTAPGLQILAGASPFPDPGFVPDELFQAIAGTSMSSPHVAGLFALISQEHPDWSAAAAKSALMTTADTDVRDNDRVSQATPFEMGSGQPDLGGPGTDGSAFRPGLVYDAGFFDYVGFLCDEAPDAVDPAFCEFLESIGVPTEAHNLNYPSIGVAQLAGSETVTRTVTSVAPGTVDYEVSVEAPDGYDVTVTPSTFSIVEGGTQTFEVEIDNLTGPIGEWAFGSLTWNDSSGDFAVRSPIAVRGSLFAAPEEVEGSGVNGSASFEVKFGYTGDYEALAHGLVPATLTVDNVLQDPDQTFDPADVAAGGANAHTFALSGAAHFRIAIPPEATEADADLDVYVFDPTNTLVAQSTLGGTDELIDISSPADGTWTVYVHGWQAPGGDSDYTMYSWAISETPGGNLRIVSAPTSATLGATGTVTVSWTGAAIGQWHLGAVSHNRGSEVLGLTLVEVDNRS